MTAEEKSASSLPPEERGALSSLLAPASGKGRGRQVGAEPRFDLVQWMGFVNRLASLSRFSMESVARRESVLEHLGQVTLTSLMISYEVSEAQEVDVFLVLARAVTHDVEEAITGDVARPTKHASTEARELFAALSRKSIRQLSDSLKLSVPRFAQMLPLHHQEAKSEGVEGLIVSLADILAVVTKVWEETILRGSGAMIRQAYTAQRQLVQFQLRLDHELDKAGQTHRILSVMVLEALEVIREAIKRDSRWLGTEVERY